MTDPFAPVLRLTADWAATIPEFAGRTVVATPVDGGLLVSLQRTPEQWYSIVRDVLCIPFLTPPGWVDPRLAPAASVPVQEDLVALIAVRAAAVDDETIKTVLADSKNNGDWLALSLTGKIATGLGYNQVKVRVVLDPRDGSDQLAAVVRKVREEDALRAQGRSLMIPPSITSPEVRHWLVGLRARPRRSADGETVEWS